MISMVTEISGILMISRVFVSEYKKHTKQQKTLLNVLSSH